jgi:hypothetical protein
MSAIDDRELRVRFVALREHDAASAPHFSDVLLRFSARAPARRMRIAAIAALGAAAIVTAVALVARTRGVDRSLDAAIAQAQSLSSWTAPTDAWLTLSGLEIPNSVPTLSLSSVTLPETSAPAATQGETR